MSHIPLYKHELPGLANANANAGLRFNKFCNTWHKDWSLSTDKNKQKKNPKQEWINKFTNLKDNENLLKETFIRRELLLKHRAGKGLTMQTKGAFVTGLGNPHPVENGFTWHHTLGVPYLPGSSVKGLVRDWMKNWLTSIDNQQLRRLFGSEKKDGTSKNQVGNVIFLDALPVNPVKLKTEIMTPHYGDYYQDETGKTAPGDWLNPTPIPFLAVDQDQIFQFAVLPRCKNDATHNEDIQLICDCLMDALTNLGAGAKTATGYGLMRETTISKNYRSTLDTAIATEQEQRAKVSRAVKETLQRDSLSANEKQLYDLDQQLSCFANTHVITRETEANKLRTSINQITKNASQWSESERQKVAERLSKIYQESGLFSKKQIPKKLKELKNIWNE